MARYPGHCLPSRPPWGSSSHDDKPIGTSALDTPLIMISAATRNCGPLREEADRNVVERDVLSR